MQSPLHVQDISDSAPTQGGTQPPAQRGPLLLRVPEAAALLGISRSKAYELIAAGVLPSLHLGASVRVPRASLLDWIDRETRGGSDEE